MMTWLVKTTNEYRIESMPEVKQFHEELQQRAIDNGITLSSFSWTEKQVREGKEVVGEYYLVKATFLVNDVKDPITPIFDVRFKTTAQDLIGEEEE